MIKSSTQLLSDIKELDDLVSSTTIETYQKEEELKLKREFLLHLHITLKYFCRISWQHKLKFLTDLAKHLNSIGTLELLLNTLYTVSGKTTVYCKCEPDIKFNYDKAPDDHDRMLDDHAMQEYGAIEVEWFKTIHDDNEQVMVIILLLRSAGGNIVWKFYSILQKLFAQKQQQADQLHLAKEQEAKDHPQKEKENSTPESTKSEHDPEDPLHMKCEKLLAKWDETIRKYRIKVEKEENRLSKLYGKKDDKKKGKKGKKTQKGKKNKKEKKKSKKGSKKQKKNKKDSSCDWIQLLPLGTIKRIFNYLDNKTLKKCKKVNDYWNWVITDLLKDKKARKALNKMIANLNKSIDISDSSKIYEFEEPKIRRTVTEKRIKRGLNRGAILEKLRETNDPLVDESVNQIIVCEGAEEYIPPLCKTKIFPRVAKARTPLYKFPNLICLDVDKIICIDPASNYSESTFGRTKEESIATSLTVSKTEDSGSSQSSSQSVISHKEYTINI